MTSISPEKIYEASVVPELWPALLDQISKIHESAFGTLFMYGEGVQKFVGTAETERLISDFLSLNQPKLNSRIDRGIELKDPGFLTDFDLFSESEIARDPFYQDFMYPRGYGWVAFSHFPLPTGETVIISFERLKERGPFENEFVSSLDGLRPHLGRAAVLSAQLGLERAKGMAQALNAAGIPGSRAQVERQNVCCQSCVPGFDAGCRAGQARARLSY